MPRMYTKGEFSYVLMADRGLPKEKQAVFKLRTLSAEKAAELEDGIIAATTEQDPEKREIAVQHKGATVTLETLKYGLAEWDNFSRNGTEILFKHPQSSICARENIEQLHPSDRHELADAITEGNSLSEEDSKNSESASGSEQARTNSPAASAPKTQA